MNQIFKLFIVKIDNVDHNSNCALNTTPKTAGVVYLSSRALGIVAVLADRPSEYASKGILRTTAGLIHFVILCVVYL